MADLTLQRGVSSGWYVDVVDEAGDPADLTGYTVKSQVRRQRSHTSDLLHEFTVAIVGSRIVATYTAAQSFAWDWDSGYCDAVLVDSSGVRRQVIPVGPIRITPAVTGV